MPGSVFHLVVLVHVLMVYVALMDVLLNTLGISILLVLALH
jgi:hypothetical protein